MDIFLNTKNYLPTENKKLTIIVAFNTAKMVNSEI